MKTDVLMAGFGGQGILLAGRLLAEAAMRAGFNATWFPSYGPEMRGGTANCTTIFSDEEIGAPISATYDVVVAMNQPSVERFGPAVREGGFLLINQDMVPIQWERAGRTTLYLPANGMARELGNERCANVVMLGALLATSDVLSFAPVDEAIRAVIGAKKANVVDVNLKALRAGHEAAAQHLQPA